MKDWLRNIFKDKKGMGTVEVILIIVVLVGLVIIFKGKITGVVNQSDLRKKDRSLCG